MDPDIEVQNMPGEVLRGGDPQLDRAVELLLGKIAEAPGGLPEIPPYPVKKKVINRD